MANLIKRARHTAILKKLGFHKPGTMLAEADRAGISHALAAAMTEQETWRGQNIYGHDPTIFIGAGQVTKENYRRYKRLRGTTHMQGVGPLQLTWWATQDAADKLGGCWREKYNWRVGFSTLAALIHQYGWGRGIARYNGSGPAADAYSRSVRERYAHYRKVLK